MSVPSLRRTIGRWFVLTATLVVLLWVSANAAALQAQLMRTPTRAANSALKLTDPSVVPSSVTPARAVATVTDQIEIPSLGVLAPIVWNIPEQDVEEQMSNGVVHVAGTALPGTAGNAVLFGHSSDYPWKHNRYATVFTLLSRLKEGDTVTVWRSSQPLNYQVVRKRIVSPDQVEMTRPTGNQTITLVTCWPVGTSWKRYIVQGERE